MDDRTQQLENGRIGPLLLTFARPAIIATAATSCYNIIDRMFIGNGVGTNALAGLGITLPVMNLSTALGTLVGAGAAALVSLRIGERRREEATRILCNALLLNIIISIAFTILMLAFLDPILLLFGADRDTLPYAREFLRIILIGNVVTHIFFGLNSVMRASGYPIKAMISVLITVFCNLILAPLFIFAFHWGIRGAALATVLSQLVGACWVIAHFCRKRSYIHFEKQEMRLHLRLAGEMFAIGLAPFFIHVCASVVTILMNWQLKTHGGTPAIASYGIVAAINSLVISMILGLTHGMQPIVGFNYGAGHRDRALQTYRLTVLCATILCALCFAAVELAPTSIASAFTDDPVLTAGTTVALRLCCAMMLTLGFQVVTSNFFQSIGKARIAIFLSLSRQIIFLLPFLWLLPPAFGVMGAWYATPAADLCACAVTAVILFVFMRKRYWKTVN